jgi:DNA-binding NarL/FixJ family response regulator
MNIVIADPYPLILDGLEHLLCREKDFTVVARCTDGDQTVRAVVKHKPDILVVDVRMPQKSGLTVLSELRNRKVPTRVVLLTAELDQQQLTDAIRLGARGIVLKELPTQLIVQCIRRVHAGELWFDKGFASVALEKLLHSEPGQLPIAALTEREVEVMNYVAAGLPNSEVAKRLCISEGTVKAHLHHIYDKLKVMNRVELSRYAEQKGLIRPH